jgi:hypothetical protein
MADAIMLFGYLGLIVACVLFAGRVEDLWKPRIRVPCQEWRTMVEPIVKKCRLAGSLEMDTKFNADGSQALAALLEKMATELDHRS